MESKLLFTVSGLRIPNNCGSIDARAQNVISAFVPFESENGAFMLSKSIVKVTGSSPNSGKDKIVNRKSKNRMSMEKSDPLEKFSF